ncbi:MAG: TIGR04086 family membrane protein [Firmicutes bacterium]|nr:TIGR04086 family membrane protein [Bacillota bacterium]
MVVNRKPTGKAMSIPGGLAVGALFSIGATLLLTAVLAKLVEGETVQQENIGYGVMVILTVSAFTGALVSFGRIKRQRLLVCGLSGLLYFVILMSMTALFFGGQYSSVGVTALLILLGSAVAALLGLKQGGGGRRKKIKVNRS